MRRAAFASLFLSASALAPVLAEDVRFQSPTGNIQCISGVYDGIGEVRCDLADVRSTLRRPRDCDLDFGAAFSISAAGRRGVALCHGDTARGPGYPVLQYGQTWSGNGIVCLSDLNGMHCTNKAGHGFHIARAKQSVF